MTIPAEDATIFATELGQGDLLDAIGLRSPKTLDC
jgi:hypothetical protein